MENFTHGPIDLGGPAFRLLRLLKGRGAVIRCQVFQAWLRQRQDAISYEAVSYAWGSTERKYRIEVNDKIFEVTKNLYELLRSLQLQHQDRLLWVDAICIDQTNNAERGHQVQHMSEIYREAHRVIYWLGPPTNLTSMCLQSLRRLQEETIKARIACNNWDPTDQRWKNLWDGLNIKLPALHREGLYQLLDRSWFKRVWILQEVANSNTAEVHCGSKFVSARIFSVAPFLMNLKLDIHRQAVFDIMPGSSREGSWWSRRRDLYTLLKIFSGSEASDPRDLIYALLGMSSDNPDIQPDYGKTEEEVVSMAIRSLFCFAYDPKQTPAGPQSVQELRNQLNNLDNIALEFAAGNQSNGDETVEYLLQHRGPSISVTNKALRVAAGNSKKGRKILERLFLYLQQTTPQAHSHVDYRGLIQAAAEIESGGDDIVQFLLARGDPRACITGNLLEVAARNRSKGKRLVELFLGYRDGKFEITPGILDAAAENDMCGDEIVKVILQRGYGMNMVTENIIKSAARNQRKGNKVLQLLLEGTQLADGDEMLLGNIDQMLDWVKPYSKVSRSLFELAYGLGRRDILQLLFNWMPGIDSRWSGSGLLFSACKAGDLPLVELLLDRGVDVNRSTHDILSDGRLRFTPLMIASQSGDTAMVNLLLEAGKPNINATTLCGASSIHLAAERGHIEVVRLLLSKGADIHATTFSQDKSIHLAVRRGHVEVVRLLLSKGADINATALGGASLIRLAALHGHVEVVRLLLSKGADTTSRGKNEIRMGSCDPIVKLLCAEYPKPRYLNILPAWIYRRVLEDDKATIRQLLDHGADIDLRFKDRKALWWLQPWWLRHRTELRNYMFSLSEV